MAIPRPSSRRNVVSLNLPVQTYPSAESLASLLCLTCGGSLDFHQPDPELPERMLGTCDGCKSWHLLTFEGETSAAILIQLPTEAALPTVPA